MRVFAAIRPDASVISAIAEYIDGLKGTFPTKKARWVSSENLHITLRFDADLPSGNLTKYIDHAAAIAGGFEQFHLLIAGTGAFAGKRGSVALWLGVEGFSEIDNQDFIYRLAALFRGSSEVQKRQSKPHLTIARLHASRSNSVLIKAHRENAFESRTCPVNDIHIYESILLPSGPRYRELASILLAEKGSFAI